MQKILKSYLRRLNNLSGNSRSLLLKRLGKEQAIDLHDFNFAEDSTSFSIINQLIEQQNQIFLCNDIDSRSKSGNELGVRLKKLSRTERFIFQERGAKDLYVGWPFVQGKFVDDTPVRCPLLFFPVSLERIDNRWFLQRRADVNITLNKTFLLAYSYYNGIPLDEELLETVIDEYDNDSTVFRTQLYNLLKHSLLEINFNQENFADELRSFPDMNKSQLETGEKTGALKLYPQAVLGIFPQAGSYLVPDYIELLDKQKDTDLEAFFLQKIQRENENQMALFDRTSEENTFTPFPLDAYQEKALKEIKRGNSLVVQGPPGTGKSQLISNLICDFIARGKNVLLVCQKKAALDVVYQRLKEKEMHDFVALVHDFKNDRKSIYEQINQQIESLDVYKKKNNGLDAIQLERRFLQACRRIDMILEELEDFRGALFNEKECGKSAKELYLTCSPEDPHFSMNLEYRAFHFSDLPEVERKFKSYLTYHQRFENKTHFWSKGPSFKDFQSSDLLTLKKLLKEIPAFNEQLIEKSKAFSLNPIDFDTAFHFSNKIPELVELVEGLKEAVIYKVYQQLHANRPTKDLNWLTQIERTIMACYRGAGIETSVKSENLGRFQEVLQSAMLARKNPLKWLSWSLFSKEKTFLKRVLVANNLKSNRKDFNLLVKKVDNRLNFEHSLTLVEENEWLDNFPKTFRKIDLQEWFYWQKMGLNMYAVAQTIRSLEQHLSTGRHNHEQYLSKLKQFLSLSESIPEKIDTWKRYLNIHQIRSIILEKEDVKSLEKTLNKDFDALCEYHQLKASLSSEERKVLDELTNAEAQSIEDTLAIFHNSLSLAWIDHIESKYPELRSALSGKLEEHTGELYDQIEYKREFSKDILLMKSREKTYENLEYNRLNNRVTYRDLQHQVTKKRRIWPIRRLIAEFTEELFTILPCWMCSPESASAIFPMAEKFDLVIFDEASQCFAERGIPAMYRGRQVVVVGDSMQLQPSDLYRVRWDEDDDEVPELAIDSLLDLTKQYLPEVALSGHYRSKSLELIDFSNQHFYDGKLRLLPDYQFVNKENPAIQYIKTDGIWQDGVNESEAQEVVSQALKLIESSPEKEIGIVTFNYRQQAFILDLIEQQAAEKSVPLPDSLFVKNIENVQGDERDIILFSIGYAPDQNGKLKLQFGSLNADGGENRLNVAVTRAREEVRVVCSIKPQQLQTADTKNKGPKLLASYLQFAWDVSHGTWTPHIPEDHEHRLDWFLRSQLQDQGFHESEEFQLIKDLPFADLSVKKGDTYTGLILTDDERYYSALSPKQIYGYEHLHLKMKNWPHVRFHSREIWIDREGTKEKMRKFLFSNK